MPGIIDGSEMRRLEETIEKKNIEKYGLYEINGETERRANM